MPDPLKITIFAVCGTLVLLVLLGSPEMRRRAFVVLALLLGGVPMGLVK